MKYRVSHTEYPYNPSASFFLLECKRHWLSRWKVIRWYDFKEGELAYYDLNRLKNKCDTDDAAEAKEQYYCSEEQTKFALELGAPIDKGYHNELIDRPHIFIDSNITDNSTNESVYLIPTMGWMIDWLTNNSPIERIVFIKNDTSWNVYIVKNTSYSCKDIIYRDIPTIKEALDMAITASLKFIKKIKDYE